jgi:PAS domain S-box-containing protein
MPDMGGGRWKARWARPSRRIAVLLTGGLLFAGLLALSLSLEGFDDLTFLYVLPITIVAIELGFLGGVAAGILALGLFVVFALTEPSYNPGGIDEVSRGVAFLVLGGVTGALGDHLRRLSAESERFWELSTDLLCTAGFDGYFKRLNGAWERTLGWTLPELRSQPFIDFVHPEDREQTEAEAQGLTTVGHETVNFANRYRHRDGTYRTLLWAATSIPEHRVIYASARDVTERERAEEELRDSERFLDSVLEHIPNMVFVKDVEELRFVRFNRAGEKLLGYSREDLMGKSDRDLFPSHEADFFIQRDREVLASHDVVDIPEEPIDTRQHGSRTLHTRKIAIRDDRGQPCYLLGISEDITDRKLAEQAADEARAQAEQANRAKSEFLSRMSHELRTPLNAVIGFAQLLELDDLDPRQRDGVEQILKAGRHLLELINEVLDISRIESGTISISVEPVHLGSVLAEALSLIRPLADEAGVHLLGDPAELADLHVRADYQRLKQVLINLLSNAVKYNRRGGQIAIRRHESPDGQIELGIADTGRGLSADALERLFDPFDRLGAEGTAIEGTGLGLALSKRLMDAMGGTIAAESEPDVGTTMWVRLRRSEGPPQDAATAIALPVATSASPTGTIVYIEDNLSNVKLVERMVARLPEVRVIPAMQGKLGIDLTRRHHPDLVLLDLHLPDLHGREVLEQLKRDPATAAIPVVVVSADATSGQVERLMAGGATDYLPKPIDLDLLLKTITRMLQRGSPELVAPRVDH